MNTKIRALIFDLDGTLLDTLDDIVTCVNAGLATLGEESRSREAICEAVGDGVDSLCRSLLRDAGPDRVQAMVSRIKTFYRDELQETAQPYPGIAALLAGLRDDGIPLAVLSNKPHEQVQSLTASCFPTAGFVEVLGQKSGLPKKPDPAGAVLIAEKLSLDPATILYVGDTEVDIQTARSAGMPVAAVTWGFRTAGVLAALAPDCIVDTPSQLLRLSRSFF